MPRLLAVAALLAAATGCIIIDDGPDTVVVDDPVYNRAPRVRDAWATCAYDTRYRDDILTLEAIVDDPDGWRDVMSVWADVYDDWTGDLVQSFELYPTDDPNFWFSDWLVSTTWIDCWYGYYSVDFVAYDSYDAFDVYTTWPATYAP